MGQCPADPEEHRALGSDPPVEEVPYPGGQQADSPYRSRRRRGCGTVGRRSRSRQGALGRRRRPAHTRPLRCPRAAARPALPRRRHITGTRGTRAAGAEGRPAGPAWAAGTEHSALSGARCRPQPGGDAGGPADSRETSSKLPRKVWDRPEVQPPGRVAPAAHISLLPSGHTLLDPHAPADHPPGRDPTWTDPRRPLGTGPSLPGEGNGSPGARSGHPPQKQPLAINKAAGHLPSRLMLEARRAFIDPLWAGAVVP